MGIYKVKLSNSVSIAVFSDGVIVYCFKRPDGQTIRFFITSFSSLAPAVMDRDWHYRA